MRFSEYYLKEKTHTGITLVDIDETTFHTFAKIKVIKDGKVVRELDNQEFNTYELKPGESFDFEQFADAELFYKTSKPMQYTIDRLQWMIYHIKKNSKQSKIIFLTARSDFDNKERFLQKFREHGIDVDFKSNIYIERSGNIRTGTTAQRKEKIVRKYLDTGTFDIARMWDDDDKNLENFLSLQKDYPDIKFMAYKIMSNGRPVRVK